MEHQKETMEIEMSTIEFAHLGGGEVAYIKELTSDQALHMFPTMTETDFPKGIPLFVLHAADGTPLSIADSKSGAIGDAIEHDLEPLSLH
ncbi:MAG: DUF1150 domain-containing protein [Pseudomonadota bacterium]